MSPTNADLTIPQRGLGYLLAVQGRPNPVMDAALEAAEAEDWAACEGWDGRPKKRLASAGSDGGGVADAALPGAFAGAEAARAEAAEEGTGEGA